ncbi:17353_t:CDS:2, partial [Cetraspora pellucida]
EDSRESMDPFSVDLHKFYSAKQWKAVHNLVQLIGFKDIDDTNILSEDALLLFGFKTRAKGISDLNATIKFINAILSNWCGYTIRSGATYGFVTQEEITAIKVNNSKYFPIGPILPLYKSELIDETQDLFDSISITNNITSECTKHEVSDLSNNEIDEKDLFLEMPAQYDAEHKKNSSQDICHVNITTFEANAYEKEISDFLISLSSEFLIKSESDMNMLIFYLQQKFQMSREKLEQ